MKYRTKKKHVNQMFEYYRLRKHRLKGRHTLWTDKVFVIAFRKRMRDIAERRVMFYPEGTTQGLEDGSFRGLVQRGIEKDE